MTDTPSPSPAEIAAKLTKAQQHELAKLTVAPRLKSVSWCATYGYRFEKLSLAKRTLLGDRTYLTPLGEGVAAILQQEQTQCPPECNAEGGNPTGDRTSHAEAAALWNTRHRLTSLPTRDAADPRGPWPAGLPDEADIRAKIARALEEVPCSPTIRRGDLERLDQVISMFEAMRQFEPIDSYDDLWNLRNHLVPFKPGDEHYDPSGDEDEA